MNKDINVMKLYYGNESNGTEPQPLNEVYKDRILNEYAKEGMVMISANRSDVDQVTNIKNTKYLIADIQHFGRSYIPIYAEYKEIDNVANSYIPSFIVTNYSAGGKLMDFEHLKQFAIKMCGKYNQISVMIKAPDDVPHFYDMNGDVIVQNDIENSYNYFLNPSPVTFNERRNRSARGEIIFGFWNNGRLMIR